jgi:hypothetical protein
MSNWLIVSFVILIVLIMFGFFYLRKKNKKTGMDGTNTPPDDIYPMY